jgi:hypothetical protein
MQILVRRTGHGWTLNINGNDFTVTTETSAGGVRTLLDAFGFGWDDLSFESARYRREFTDQFAL